MTNMATSIKLRKHRGCCECGRLKHPDGTPHGKPVPRAGLQAVIGEQASRGVSHGYCTECKRKLMLRYEARLTPSWTPSILRPAPLLAA